MMFVFNLALILSTLIAPTPASAEDVDYFQFRTKHSASYDGEESFDVLIFETDRLDPEFMDKNRVSCQLTGRGAKTFGCHLADLWFGMSLENSEYTARKLVEAMPRAHGEEIDQIKKKREGLYQVTLRNGHSIFHVQIKQPNLHDDTMECQISAASSGKLGLRCRSEFDHSNKIVLPSLDSRSVTLRGESCYHIGAYADLDLWDKADQDQAAKDFLRWVGKQKECELDLSYRVNVYLCMSSSRASMDIRYNSGPPDASNPIPLQRVCKNSLKVRGRVQHKYHGASELPGETKTTSRASAVRGAY